MTELDPLNRVQLLDILREMLPHPVREESLPRETIRLIGGNPGEVVVDVDPDRVTVSEYATRQESDSAELLEPVPLGILTWEKLPAWTTRRILGELTAAAAAGRLEKFHECVRCKTTVPPEEMATDTTCRKCAAKDEGVVY